LPCSPELDTLIRVVIPVRRSFAKTSSALFVSPGTRSDADDQKISRRPSALSCGEPTCSAACS
jgi:hypothetical protein